MARFDFLLVDHIKFKLVLAGKWALTHSFTDIYAIQNLDEGNNHSLLALL